MGDLRELLEAAADRGEPAGGEAVVARAVAAVDRPRGRRAVRVVVALTVAAAVLVTAAVGGGLLYTRTKLADIDRVDLAGVLAGSATPVEPMTVLLVGSDTRGGLTLEDEQRFGSSAEISRERADSIMVLRVDPAAREVRVLSLPRDLWVPIDGGPAQRLNTALAHGPDVLIRTVQSLLGIKLDHYVQVDFDGFRRVVDAVGGVSVSFDTPVRDRVTGLLVDAAGCRELDGDQALAFVRSRHLQAQVDGRWTSDPTGDLGRIQRQQRFLLSALGQAAKARNPRTVAELLDAAADHVSTDDGLSSRALLTLGRQVAATGAAIRPVGLATKGERIGVAAVLTTADGALLAAGRALLAPEADVAEGQAAPPGSIPVPVTPEATCDK